MWNFTLVKGDYFYVIFMDLLRVFDTLSQYILNANTGARDF